MFFDVRAEKLPALDRFRVEEDLDLLQQAPASGWTEQAAIGPCARRPSPP